MVISLLLLIMLRKESERGGNRDWCVSCVCLVSQFCVCGAHRQKSFTHDDDDDSASFFPSVSHNVFRVSRPFVILQRLSSAESLKVMSK